MKATLLIFALALGVVACDLGDEPNNPVEPLSATVQLTDTSGREMTVFHPGESFDIRFALTNTTAKTLTYYRGSSAPDVLFWVFRNDSLVASSTDGYAFLMVVSTGYLEPRETLRGFWRGPTTPAQHPRVLLSPGAYVLRVSFPTFDQAETRRVPPIQFSIVE
ncbi:MAG: hypothetical protein HY961_11210 [Ignavibacteriae bacterium]|nr:hypothetical protein [Ignavibacteriota bacterium]